MINIYEVLETRDMIEKENLDVRTITMGISLLDCVSSDLQTLKDNIKDRICQRAERLVEVGREIEREFGIPIVNKRIAITPLAIVAGSACRSAEDFAGIARVLDSAAMNVGVNFLGGYSCIASKGMSVSDELLIRSIPEALSDTERVCSSVVLQYRK